MLCHQQYDISVCLKMQDTSECLPKWEDDEPVAVFRQTHTKGAPCFADLLE